MKEMQIAKLMKHKWEEEPISGIGRGYDGTFAIFFYGCTMRCAYCQNSKISRGVNNVGASANAVGASLRARIEEANANAVGASLRARIEGANANGVGANACGALCRGELCEPEKINFTPEELSDVIIKAQSDNIATISFITGALYVDQIAVTIKLAKKKGLKLPVVYNNSAYETAAQIKKLDGLVDIYLPDFKYFDNELGKKYSGVPNYVDIAKECIAEMHRQIVSLNEKCRGELCEPLLIVRNLVLPGNTENSKRVIKYLFDTYGDDIYLSIMSQYTPMPQNENIDKFPELLRKVTKREYEKVVDYAISLGVKNAFIQEGDVANESFIPEFR